MRVSVRLESGLVSISFYYRNFLIKLELWLFATLYYRVCRIHPRPLAGQTIVCALLTSGRRARQIHVIRRNELKRPVCTRSPNLGAQWKTVFQFILNNIVIRRLKARPFDASWSILTADNRWAQIVIQMASEVSISPVDHKWWPIYALEILEGLCDDSIC